MTLTKSQIERLGNRLVGSRRPASDDLAALHELLLTYDHALSSAVGIVQDRLGVTTTSRIKSTGTILEKLDRYGGSWLKSIHDLAGMRIVGMFDRAGQDALVDELVSLFSVGLRQPKLIDRRKTPSYGYRAVHVVVWTEARPIEIQVRTQLQHEWADLFEKLADQIGRGIRYGEPPQKLAIPDGPPLSARAQSVYDRSYRLRLRVLELVRAVADAIDGFEVAELTQGTDPRLSGLRDRLQERLQSVHSLLGPLAEVTSAAYDALSARL